MLEFIECLAKEAFGLVAAGVTDLKQHEAIIRPSVEAAHTIRSITNFMLSTVNRCLDYTKVLHRLPSVLSRQCYNTRICYDYR